MVRSAPHGIGATMARTLTALQFGRAIATRVETPQTRPSTGRWVHRLGPGALATSLAKRDDMSVPGVRAERRPPPMERAGRTDRPPRMRPHEGRCQSASFRP